jgi:hypothetical protein
MDNPARNHNGDDNRRLPPSIVQPLELVERSQRRASASVQDSRLVVDQTTRRNIPSSAKESLAVADSSLVAEAALWIRSKVAATVKRGAMEVGEYVLGKFFLNSPDLVRSKDPRKSASFRALANRCGTPELPVSKTWLNNAVGIALMTRLLPEKDQAFRALPPSYQESLLPLVDPVQVERVAKQASVKKMTFRQLRQLVAKERAKMTTPRTKSVAMPRLLELLESWLRCLDIDHDRSSIARANVEELSEEQREQALRQVSRLIDALECLVRLLRQT